MQTKNFQYDVFLTYAVADRAAVRLLAERLRGDGLKVWFDLWELREVSKNEHFQKLAVSNGLKNSRALLLCMSDALFDSDASRAEQNAILYRDPLEEGRRLIPVLLEETKIPSWLGSFVYADWRDRSDKVYAQIRDACLPPPKTKIAVAGSVKRQGPSIASAIPPIPQKTIRSYSKHNSSVLLATFGGEIWEASASLNPDRNLLWNASGRVTALTANSNKSILAVCRNGSLVVKNYYGNESKNLVGHDGPVLSVLAINNDTFLSAGADGTIKSWDFITGIQKAKFNGHTGAVRSLTTNSQLIVSGSHDSTIRLWDHSG